MALRLFLAIALIALLPFVWASCTSYTVVSGDTCYAIANNHQLTVAQLQSYNPSADCSNLHIGQALCLSAPTTTTASCTSYTVVSGDTCYAIANSHQLTVAQLQSFNPSADCSNLHIGQVLCLSAPPTTTGSSSTSGGSTSGACSLSSIFSASDFTTLFPNANGAAKRGDAGQYGIFTYDNLIKAAQSFPAFTCVGDVTTRKRELAAFLAQTSQESSAWWSGQPYVWGYFYSTELCLGTNNCPSYCSSGQYPCAGGQVYCGRGPLQLSWNYNYALASQAIFGDSSVLVNNPNQVLTDGSVAFKAALWFWMTAQAPKPSCHDVMTGGWTPSSADVNAGRLAGFGMVTNIVNGAIECQQPSAGSTNRQGYFETYVSYFKVSDGGNVACDKMQHY